jgi:hypothetical protein
MALFVLIKGNKFEVAKACADRGIPFAFKFEHYPWKAGKFVETSGLVPSDYHAEIASWFISAPHEAPFPVGTVLHYSFKD